MSEKKYQLKGKGSLLTVYDDHIIIENKGILGLMTHGLAGGKTIPMESIRSVQFKKGSMIANGFLQFGIEGGREKQGGVWAASGDENSIVFERSNNGLAEEIKKYIESIIFNRSKAGTQTIIQQQSSADQILKYKELLDKGIINQSEFELKKKELLGL